MKHNRLIYIQVDVNAEVYLKLIRVWFKVTKQMS